MLCDSLRVFFVRNTKFGCVEGERGILSRRWSMWRCFYYSSKNKTLLALVHCIPCFFAAELCAEALSQEGLRQVLLRRLLYCLICEYICQLGWSWSSCLADCMTSFHFQTKENRGAFSWDIHFWLGNQTSQVWHIFLLLLTHVFDCSTVEIFVFEHLFWLVAT